MSGCAWVYLNRFWRGTTEWTAWTVHTTQKKIELGLHLLTHFLETGNQAAIGGLQHAAVRCGVEIHRVWAFWQAAMCGRYKVSEFVGRDQGSS